MKYYYTYLITNTRLGKYYHGKHTSKCHPIKEIGITYFSTSKDKEFLQDQKYNSQDYEYMITGIYHNTKESGLNEEEYHETLAVRNNKSYYNKHNAGSQFDTIGTSAAKDMNGNKLGCVSIDDERWLTGEIVGISKGFIHAKNLNGEYIGQVSSEDERWKINEITGTSIGKVIVKDSGGNIFCVGVNNERYLSGSLVVIWKGKTHTIESKNKIGKANSILQIGKGNSCYGTHIYISPITKQTNRHKEGEQPDGWITTEAWKDSKKLKKTSYGFHWYNDGIKNYLLNPSDPKIEGMHLSKKRIQQNT
jgi:hypothetical protein